ncbi:type I-E CRISPR-associated protein Cse2/CasB [Planomonospora sp. ID67723]|uniref:type I-E CRISPR-associated protein Cse2/CasB n=1 Tax=Planomonospora sp. ID67723 TaxID=2738134 RepID=UPI0018C3D5F1|nr:type I-E CRISPR-associated protein Cse2/CasB [Planomonospora sp. ID67723]MBG0828217.1 type I-E CRISPR-associated protein Cse2/CasB [Planomonospora sp. ID67723]
MSVIPSISTADKYVNHLDKVVRRDPGRRSGLRRGLGRPVDDAMVRKAHAVVVPWLPVRPGPAVESAYYSVAALIAAQPSRRSEEEPEAEPAVSAQAADAQEEPKRATTSIGGTLGLAVRDGKLNPTTVEERLHLLCRQDLAGLHRHLPGLVRQLAAKEITPDWGRLLVDLSSWGHGRDRVTKRWLQDFYRAMNSTTHDNGSESEDQ